MRMNEFLKDHIGHLKALGDVLELILDGLAISPKADSKARKVIEDIAEHIDLIETAITPKSDDKE